MFDVIIYMLVGDGICTWEFGGFEGLWRDLTKGKEIMDLISKMVSSPDNRLGCRGMGEIKAHPFFTGIDWKNLRNSKTPFVPEVTILFLKF